MRIRSSTVEAHQFPLVRRRGYDPDEVDLVMQRLAESLREYEELTARLQQELGAAEESSEAIKRTFVAAQRTRDEMIAEAALKAEATLESATADAAKVITEAETQVAAMLDQARRQVEEMLDEARREREEAAEDAEATRTEANEIIDVAKAKAESIRAQADEVITSSMAEAEATREEAAKELRRHQAEARDTLQRAKDEAERLTAEARSQAERAVSEASSEAAEKSATSRREAETLVASAINEAKGLRSRVKAETDEYRANKQAEADELVTVAENEANELRTKATAEAATATARARAEAEAVVKRAKADAADRVSAAQARSDEILDAAQRRADEVTRDAREEKIGLERRVAQLRTAVSDVERELQKLSATALERVGLIGGMIDLEHRAIEEPTDPDVAPGPAAVAARAREHVAVGTAGSSAAVTIDLTTGAVITPDSPDTDVEETIDDETAEPGAGGGGRVPAPTASAPAEVRAPAVKPRHEVPEVDALLAELRATRTEAYADPDGSGLPPAARPLVEPETPADETDEEAGGSRPKTLEQQGEPERADTEDGADAPTIYQRRAGGIRRRIEQARPRHPER